MNLKDCLLLNKKRKSKFSESNKLLLRKLEELGNTHYRKIIEIVPELMNKSETNKQTHILNKILRWENDTGHKQF